MTRGPHLSATAGDGGALRGPAGLRPTAASAWAGWLAG
jgi:hypothetical protein